MTDEAAGSTDYEADVERMPAWTHLASAGVIVVGALVAARLVDMLVVLPLLVLSSLGRRFGVRRARITVSPDGIVIDQRALATRNILDVWLDDDEVDPRVVIAFGDDIEVIALRFADRKTARNVFRALAPGTSRAVVAGSRPRLVDLLASLRFIAIAAAFVLTGSRVGLLVVVFFVLGVWSFVRTAQVVVRDEQLEVRRAFSTRSYPLANVASADEDAGAVELKDGSAIDLSRGALRDATMTPAPWLARARTRLFDAVRSRAIAASK